MPQLNPAPWLVILLISWATLLTIFNPKVTAALLQNLPLTHNQTAHKTTPWDWPWT